MFDYVDYKAKCENCDNILDSWQTKSGPRYLAHLKPMDVFGTFYDYCKCGKANEYEVKKTALTDIVNNTQIVEIELVLIPDTQEGSRPYIGKEQ